MRKFQVECSNYSSQMWLFQWLHINQAQQSNFSSLTGNALVFALAGCFKSSQGRHITVEVFSPDELFVKVNFSYINTNAPKYFIKKNYMKYHDLIFFSARKFFLVQTKFTILTKIKS